MVQGKLFSFLSKPLYEKPIENLEELVDSNLQLKFIDGMRVLFDENDRVHREILNRGAPLPNFTFMTYAYEAYSNNYAVIIEEGVLILQPSFRTVLQMFEIHNFIMCYYMPMNHILYEYFDKMVRRIIESGFLDKIVSEMKFNYANIGYVFEEKVFSKVSFDQIEIALFILLLGYILSITAFVLEIFYCRKSFYNS